VSSSLLGDQSLPPRLLFWGMLNSFSYLALQKLLEARVMITAVLLPSSHPSSPHQGSVEPPVTVMPRPSATISTGLYEIPLLSHQQNRDIRQLAWEHQLPVYAINRLDDPATIETVSQLQPEVACVACFPWRIPNTILTIPPAGFLNIHPSLLPHYRGPAPLFWALRAGERQVGVTIHFMNEALDRGDIVGQEAIDLPEGISGTAVENLCAATGGRLLAAALAQLAEGTLLRRPQPAGGSYQPWPASQDFHLDTTWPAKRAYNFMKGTVEWRQPYSVWLANEQFRLSQAIHYSHELALTAPFSRAGSEIRIQFNPGVLQATLAPRQPMNSGEKQ
jgi:methionyl-tRNA formyltransferase